MGASLDLLKWVRANGCEHGARGLEWAYAFQSGRLDVLQWLRADGCSWGRLGFLTGAFCGQLAAVIWARAEGCPWHRATQRLRVATSMCCSGRTRMAAHGITTRTRPQRIETPA
jgi:hypothetical protein